MSTYPQFIDNRRKNLAEVLRDIAPNYKTLRIATGYWDLPGTLEIINELQEYDLIELLIGQEPLPSHLQKKFNINDNSGELFPDAYIKSDLESSENANEINQLRDTASKLVTLIKNDKLQVKVYRQPRLHAKAYIFGNLGDGDSVGVIGSSNFTRAGLTTNSELNFLTDDYKIVEFEPQSENQENGHLTWFKELWNSEDAEDWNGDFTNILRDSPMGDKTYGPYDVYIKTLMEIFPDELMEVAPFDENTEHVLYDFQKQNALSLRRKLDRMGVAMLSDSVGLGKTITAAAIINQYIQEGKNNIKIIPPASLKQQWIDELQSNRWNLRNNADFEVISQQDSRKFEELIEYSGKQQNTRNEVDLFVIDEAHNLRNINSSRHNKILELLQSNPNSKVLLLTATPVNNSLMDFANQIQLGSKGDLVSVKVPYSAHNKLEYIDFFEALKRIQSEVTRAEKNGKQMDWSQYRSTLTAGIRHYLVRSTRQGVVKRNAIKPTLDGHKLFPETKVENLTYTYHHINENEHKSLNEKSLFNNFSFRDLNLDFAGEITQRTQHPIDLFNTVDMLINDGQSERVIENYAIDKKYTHEKIFDKNKNSGTVIPTLYQLINFLGFTPYKPDSYRHDIYGKTIPEIRALNIKGHEGNSIRVQLSIHNMLHVTWLKRLESSTMTLLQSVRNYKERIQLFEKWLDNGYIVSLADATLLSQQYEDDIEQAFSDYDSYLYDVNNIMDSDQDSLKKRGVSRKAADPKIFNITQLRIDIERDKKIVAMLESQLLSLSKSSSDMKLKALAEGIKNISQETKHGRKILVFSYFSDTIDYLQKALPPLLGDSIPDFQKRAAFISGKSTHIESIARRFSPTSKHYHLKSSDQELDYLFATDVLSEGQNLQDSGILVNYDLHWNPVRMIQRNGRINRLGSKFSEVLIVNARPNDDLETYLKLVRRLERKIETINFTVGNDQSILGELENPIEFNDLLDVDDIYSTDSSKATAATKKMEETGDVLDWTDDYALELRAFIDAHQDDNEVNRIMSIPKGKWNYLPKSSQEEIPNTDEVIGLYTTDGRVTSTNEVIHDTGFVKIDKSAANRGPFSSIRTTYIEDRDALKKIKTTVDDNASGFDTIRLDRQEYIEKGREEIRNQFVSDQPVYKLKGVKLNTTEYMARYFSFDLLSLIGNGIKRSNDKRDFERLINRLHKQISENGVPYAATVQSFEKFIDTLIEHEYDNKKLEKIEEILFYANHQ